MDTKRIMMLEKAIVDLMVQNQVLKEDFECTKKQSNIYSKYWTEAQKKNDSLEKEIQQLKSDLKLIP